MRINGAGGRPPRGYLAKETCHDTSLWLATPLPPRGYDLTPYPQPALPQAFPLPPLPVGEGGGGVRVSGRGRGVRSYAAPNAYTEHTHLSY